MPGETVDAAGRLGEQSFGPGRADRAACPRSAARSSTGRPGGIGSHCGSGKSLSDNASRLDGDAAGLLPGLVVGDTSGISDRLDADAKITGVTHLLAVSGSHFAILCGMVVVVLRRFGPRTAAVGGSLTLVGLVILVGPATVGAARGGDGCDRDARPAGRTNRSLRARTGRRGDRPAARSIPELAVSVGFALSVLATGGLILIAPAWSESLQRRGLPRGLGRSAGGSGGRAAGDHAGHRVDQRVGLGGRVLANLLVAPVVAPALVLGVLCALTGPWWPGAAAVLARADRSTAVLDRRRCAHLGSLAERHRSLARDARRCGTARCWLSVVAVMLLRHRRFRDLFGAAAAGVVLVLVPSTVIAPAGRWRTGC